MRFAEQGKADALEKAAELLCENRRPMMVDLVAEGVVMERAARREGEPPRCHAKQPGRYGELFFRF